MFRIKLGLLIVFGVALLGHAVSLQAQGTAATISGTVTDPSGAQIPGATVTITNVETKHSTSRTGFSLATRTSVPPVRCSAS